MSLPKISVDLPLVLDPYKFLFLLSGLDRTHSEILIPDTFEFIELWGEGFMPDVTLHTFTGTALLKTDIEKAFGFQSTDITPNNFVAGLKLLRMAYDKGMVSLFSPEEHYKTGLELLRAE